MWVGCKDVFYTGRSVSEREDIAKIPHRGIEADRLERQADALSDAAAAAEGRRLRVLNLGRVALIATAPGGPRLCQGDQSP
jgi:hypothetical protein